MAKSSEKRADELLAQMTLDEKIDYIGGTGFSVRAVERLGIPEIIMSDGPMGCRCYGKTTAYPAGIALAATWNTSFARRIGECLGKDCRSRGVHILLAPGVNIYRSPKCGRNFEYMGEDPYLSSTMVVPLIEGIQSQEVLATIKHFVCNNQEWDRHNISSEVDERTLREIYMPAFKAAIQKAKSRCLMNSYNLLNGTHCSEDDWLLNKVLRDEWGFDGFVMSDWESVYDAVNPANHGLDLEMPVGKFMNKENLMPAIQDGRVKESTIDEKVRRMLRIFIAAGFFDRPQLDESIAKDNPDCAKAALEVARESIVLLKNEDDVLPLDRNKVKSVAVVGPNAHPAVYCAGGSAFTDTFHSTSILDGIRGIVGNSVDVPRPQYLGFACPFKMEVFDNRDLDGTPTKVTQASDISFDWCQNPPEGTSGLYNYSVRWTGKIRPPLAAKYTFNTKSDDGVRVYVDDKLIIDDWKTHEPRSSQASLDLEERDYDIRVEYFQAEGGAQVSFGWKRALDVTGLADSLKDVDAIVYCAGFSRETEGEGYDRPFELPQEQIDEICVLSKSHPKVIVVLNTGGGVAWAGWLEHVPAVIEAWYPGQEVGRVVAEVIFGDVNPSGKLPATYEKREQDNPTAPYYNVNDDGKTPYTEGIFVGYRGYDKNEVEPQFCFGHGLSYTTFEFGDLKIAEKGSGYSRTIEITCSVKNTGSLTGAEVAQLYVGDVECSVPRPIRELKGFNKLVLEPGETKTASFTLSKDDLAYYDVGSKSWVVEPGNFNVYVGSSSRNLPLEGSFVW
ncbi:glycoside hydrolase family 3 C-terminal domain-containing protein [bacterium]|nr:glycoside hydrolase family 3 C-terminal domain-containing protein [bacterium]